MLLDLSQVQMYLDLAQSALTSGQGQVAETLLAHTRSLLPVRLPHSGKCIFPPSMRCCPC